MLGNEEQLHNNVQFRRKNCSFFRKLSYGGRRGSMRPPAGKNYCSKISTAGFGSLDDTITNFDGETTYTMALPAMLPAAVPLPFVGDEDME